MDSGSTHGISSSPPTLPPFVVVGGLIAWVMLDYRAQRRNLADLEKRGVTRRSAPARPEPAQQQAKEEA